MHRNPVKRGLVASPELWRWSSFRAYALGEAGRVTVNDWRVLKLKVRPVAASVVAQSGGHFSKTARSGAPHG